MLSQSKLLYQSKTSQSKFYCSSQIQNVIEDHLTERESRNEQSTKLASETPRRQRRWRRRSSAARAEPPSPPRRPPGLVRRRRRCRSCCRGRRRRRRRPPRRRRRPSRRPGAPMTMTCSQRRAFGYNWPRRSRVFCKLKLPPCDEHDCRRPEETRFGATGRCWPYCKSTLERKSTQTVELRHSYVLKPTPKKAGLGGLNQATWIRI